MPACPPRLLTVFLLAALWVSACGPAAATPVPASASPDADTTEIPSDTPTHTPPIEVDPAALRGVELRVWHAFSGEVLPLFTAQAAQFAAVNEWGLRVTATAYGDYAGLFAAVQEALAAGESPDLVVALPEQALAWDASGRVVDLNPYIGDPAWGPAETDLADIPSIFWTQDVVDGKRLGVPAQRSARFLFYNQTWANELGFDGPPVTAQDFRRQVCAANASFRLDASPQNDGYGGWVVDSNWQTVYSWLLAFGGGIPAGGTYTFQSDPNLAALEFLKGLFDENCAWVSLAPATADLFARRTALFVSGDLAEVPRVANAMARFENDDEWTVLPFPGTEGSALTVYGPSYTLLASTPERQLAAWLFARWLLSPEIQAQWVEATGMFPLRLSTVDMVGPFRSVYPQWEAALADLALASGPPPLASWRKARYLLEDGLTFIFRTNVPVEQIPSVLEEMDAMAEEFMDE